VVGLAGERRLVRHAAGLPALPVVFGKPVLGKIPPAIQEGVASAAGVTEEDAHLTVLLLAPHATPWPRHASRMVAAFGDGALVHDQHAILVDQTLGDEPAVFSQERVIVPAALADELLPRPHSSLRPLIGAHQAQRHRLGYPCTGDSCGGYRRRGAPEERRRPRRAARCA